MITLLEQELFVLLEAIVNKVLNSPTLVNQELIIQMKV
jgi:hypothetical protein